ncbi:MAG: DUF4112 domain-containing protein [Sphingomonas sp.]
MKTDPFEGLTPGITGMGHDPASIRRRVETVERLLERLFVLPGINRPVGLDVVANAIPFIGPLMTSGLGAYIVWEARNLGLSKWQLARMGGNVGFDALLGAIPFVGAIPDFFFRSNTRNLRIIRRHLDRHHPATAVVEGRVSR